VKEVLKSLTDTGYLDSDGSRGPQGYTYTLVRDAEEISLGISLRLSPESEEAPANDGIPNGRGTIARYCPMPNSGADANGHREAGANGRNGHRPIKSADLQEEISIGRTAGKEGLCIHELEASVCKVCNGYVRRLIESQKRDAQ
jgi:hypothetical protein